MPAEPKIGPNRGNAGKGRPKGATNKVTGALKDMILGALNDAGGQAYLKKHSEKNPTAFLTLVGKVLPMTVAGDPDAPLVITAIERRVVDAPN
jgi:hypothetical protein